MSEEEITNPRENDSVDLDKWSDAKLIKYDICPNCHANLIHMGGCTECKNKCGFTLCG